jgi:hypothetical protein
MKTHLALAVCLVTVAINPCVAQQPLPMRYQKVIDPGSLKQEEIIALNLDSDVCAGTREGFPDLRVLDANNSEVPYLLDRVTETRPVSIRHTFPAKEVSLREPAGGGLEIEVSQDQKLPVAEGISLVTPLTNYQQRVQVLGTSDGKSWQPLVADALIFDYARYMDVSNHDVSLPGNRYRRFRVIVREITADQESQLLELTRRLKGGKEAERLEKSTIQRRPFRIDRIEFWYQETREQRKGDKKAEYPVAGFSVEQNAAARQTVIHVEARREPLTGFSLETASRNFNRRATVQIPVVKGVRTEWHDIGAETISRIDFRDLRRDELRVRFPETRQDRYRIIIDDGDDAPLTISGVRGEGNVYRLLFLAAPSAKYRLFYGSESAKAPAYDTEAVRESIGRGYQPVAARLSGQIAGPSVPETAGQTIRGLLNNWLVLGGVIVILVVVLGWGLYRAGRRIDQLPKDAGGGAP